MSSQVAIAADISMVGQAVPNVSFRVRENDAWIDVSTDELFANKTVVVFSLPGAFTPTCSSTHLPRYNELASTFAANGVDDIICISVNDTFVMNAWRADQEAENITVIPDGNGEFTDGMGMLVGKYAGHVLIDLPEAYLFWFQKQEFPDGELGELMKFCLDLKIEGLDQVIKPLKHLAE